MAAAGILLRINPEAAIRTTYTRSTARRRPGRQNTHTQQNSVESQNVNTQCQPAEAETHQCRNRVFGSWSTILAGSGHGSV